MPSAERRPAAHIQIEDMGGVTNVSRINENTRKLQSGLISETNSVAGFTKGGGDPSRLGGQATRATDYTSNIGMHTEMGVMGGVDRSASAIGTGGQALSNMFQAPGSQSPTVAGTEYGGGGQQTILNYPYSYDQD